MPATPQSQAVQTTNQLIAAASALMSLYNVMLAIDAEWTDDQVATALTKIKTFPLSADGTMGTTPDTTPNANNPMDTSTGISRAISSTQVAQLKSTLDAVVQYLNGQAVAANAGARAIINAAVGG